MSPTTLIILYIATFFLGTIFGTLLQSRRLETTFKELEKTANELQQIYERRRVKMDQTFDALFTMIDSTENILKQSRKSKE